MDEDLVRESIDARDEAGAEHLRALCAEYGVTLEPIGVRDLSTAALLLFSLVGSLTAVSVVVERWRDVNRGGQVIDLRPEADRIAYRDPELLFGYVLIRAVDGSVSVHVHQPANQTLEIVRVLVDVIGAMSGSDVREIAQKAEASLDGQATVEIESQ